VVRNLFGIIEDVSREEVHGKLIIERVFMLAVVIHYQTVKFFVGIVINEHYDELFYGQMERNPGKVHRFLKNIGKMCYWTIKITHYHIASGAVIRISGLLNS